MSRPPDATPGDRGSLRPPCAVPDALLYDPLDPTRPLARQERERALIRCIRRAGLAPVGDKRVLEVGCGGGTNLVDLIRLGFQPHNLVGNELWRGPPGPGPGSGCPAPSPSCPAMRPRSTSRTAPSMSSSSPRSSPPSWTTISSIGSRAGCGRWPDRRGHPVVRFRLGQPQEPGRPRRPGRADPPAVPGWDASTSGRSPWPRRSAAASAGSPRPSMPSPTPSRP